MAKLVKQPHGGAIRVPDKGEKTSGAGRPKKSWTALNDALEKDGIKPVSKDAYRNVVVRLMNCTQKKINEIIADEDIPLWIKLIITDLKNSKTRGRVMEDLRNYVLGNSAADLSEIEEKTEEQTMLIQLGENKAIKI
jgi:hypothetical protein